jgi:2,4-dienoyl-CoA reductase-like NADH-dependent reductase (Old Yellow Enzyme family)
VNNFSGEADAVFLARAMLRDPYWPLHAAKGAKADTPGPPPCEQRIKEASKYNRCAVTLRRSPDDAANFTDL